MLFRSRTSNKPYQIEVVFSPINKIANRVKFVPREWITEQGNDVTHELIDYVMPLVTHLIISFLST